MILLFQTWSDEQLKVEQDNAAFGWIADLLPFVLGLIVLAVVIALVMSLVSMLKNPATLKSFGIGLVALAVIAGIAYALSGGDVIPERLVELGSNQGTYNLVGAGILMTILLIAAGLLAILWGVIKGILKS